MIGALLAGGILGWLALGMFLPTPSASKRTTPSLPGKRESKPQIDMVASIDPDASPASRVANFAALVGSASSANDLAGLYQQIGELHRYLPEKFALEVLLPQLAQLDAELAFRSVREKDRKETLKAIATIHPDEALEIIRKMPVTEKKDYFGAVLEAIAGSDPERALELLASEESEGFKAHWPTRRALAELAKRDPLSAVAWFKEHSSDHQWSIVDGLIEGWAEVDPKGALQWIKTEKVKGSDPWDLPAGAVFRTWSKNDPFAAINALFESGDNKLIRQAAPDVLTKAAAADPERTLEFINSRDDLRHDLRLAAMEGIARSLAATDPQRAIELASEIPEKDRYQANYAIGTNLAATDLEAAYEWANGQSGDSRAYALNTIVSSLYRKGNEALMDFIDRTVADGAWNGASNRSINGLAQIVLRVARDDEAVAVEWLQGVAASLPEDVFKRSLYFGQRADPELVGALVEALPDSDLSRPVVDTAASIGIHDPEAAVEWVESLPAGAMKDDAMINIAVGMAQADLESGTAFAIQLPEGKLRDRTIQKVAQVYYEVGEYAPLDLVLQTTNPSTRDGLLRSHFRSRARRDQEEARAALAELEIELPKDIEEIVEDPWSQY